ncbi:mechanosensitive ion channel family protein [Minwuia sp.]|uniref:mechanosensitive ion channel family protein n=1 Tax=Minwuia sp. TaxID=2493630 RepID=UPI003A95AC42
MKNKKQGDRVMEEPVNIMMEQLREIWIGMIEIAPQFAIAIGVLILTWVVSRLGQFVLRRALSRARMRPSLKTLLGNLLGLGVWIAGFMLAAVILFPNLTPASMIAGLGLGSIAIGFAFKDIFENFLAGLIILFRKEMRIGDHIEVEDEEGVVDHITIRETHIRQTDGQLVIIPNAIILKNPLTIRTDLAQRRTTIICGVAYGEDVDESREVIRKAVESCDTVITDGRPVQIFAQAFNSSSIDFEVTWWTGSKPVDIRTSRDQVVAAVKRALDDAGIEIPFPYRTLTFKEPLSVDGLRAGDADERKDGDDRSGHGSDGEKRAGDSGEQRSG